MNFGRFRKAVGVALSIASLALLLPAATVGAANNTVSISPSVIDPASAGASFTATLNVAIDPTTPAGGLQLQLSYNPAIVAIDSITEGTGTAGSGFFGTYAAANGGSTLLPVLPKFCNNTSGTCANGIAAGTTNTFGVAMVGQTGGVTGSGVFMTVTGHGVAVNGVGAPMTISNVKLVDAAGTQISGVTAVGATTYVGPVALADLLVVGASGAAVAPSNPKVFNVTFSVLNQGTLAAPATSATVSVAGLAPITVAVPAVAAGATSAPIVAGPFTIAAANPPVAQVTVAVNTGPTPISESNTANDTTAFQYGASSASTTTINASLSDQISITTPPSIAFASAFPLVVGANNIDAGNLNVKSNTSWEVDVTDANSTTNGHLTEWNGTTYGPLKLGAALHVVNGSTDNTMPTNAAIATGTVAGQSGNAGQSFDIHFTQDVSYADPVLHSIETYNAVVTFTGFVTL